MDALPGDYTGPRLVEAQAIERAGLPVWVRDLAEGSLPRVTLTYAPPTPNLREE